MKSNYFFTIYLFITCSLFGQENNLDLLYQWSDSSISGDNWVGNVYNDVWGFVQNGHEFAVIGSTQGTHIIDVTDPENSYLVQTIDGASTSPDVVHRDFHSYGGYLYAVADEMDSSTLQIMDLSNLPNSVTVVYDTNDIITRSHNIFIDEQNAIMYSCGGKINGSNNTLSLLSLADPENPIFITEYSTHGYVHDIYVTNHVGYLNCGSNGLHIVDFTDYNNPQTLGSFTEYTQVGYNHSGWLSEDGNTYVFADENHGYKMKVCDVSNPTDIIEKSLLLSDVASQSIAHNLIIKDNLVYVSHYHDGLWIWDISDPTNPTYVASYDTYTPSGHASYKGAWGVYPLLPSGNILVSDMQSGLFVFSPPSQDTSNIVEKNKEIIFPNPCNDILNIHTHSQELKTIKLFDIYGKTVISKSTAKNKPIIDLNHLPKGLYFLQINNPNHMTTYSIIKN